MFPDVAFRRVLAPFFLPGEARIRYTLALLRGLRHLKPALIEVHAEPRIALWLQRAFPGIPVVLFLHDDPSHVRIIRTREQRVRLLERVARVVTVSTWLRDRFMEGIEPGVRPPIVVLPGVDLAHLPASGSGVGSAERPLSQRRARLILFMGRLVAEKGADLFVSACTSVLPRLAGWRAEIIGAAEHGPDSTETQYTRLLRARADPAGIALLGYRDHPDAMIALSRAAMLAIPGRQPEAGGRVALEAMANGAVVICPPEGALPEIAGDAAFYCDPAHMADAIRSLAEDPARLTELARRGRERASMFDLPSVGRWLETVRARVIAAGPPRL